jgi:hypothetical protein
MEKKIFALVGQAPSLEAYKGLNFTATTNFFAGYTNGFYNVEADLTDYGWMSVLGVLDECKKAGLKPWSEFGGQLLTLEEAIAFADKRAAEEELAFDMRDKNDLK